MCKVLLSDTIPDKEVYEHTGQTPTMMGVVYYYRSQEERDRSGNILTDVDKCVIDPTLDSFWHQMRYAYDNRPASGIITHSIANHWLIYDVPRPVQREFDFTAWTEALEFAINFQVQSPHYFIRKDPETKQYVVYKCIVAHDTDGV